MNWGANGLAGVIVTLVLGLVALGVTVGGWIVPLLARDQYRWSTLVPVAVLLAGCWVLAFVPLGWA
jgi:hypothetical protein